VGGGGTTTIGKAQRNILPKTHRGGPNETRGHDGMSRFRKRTKGHKSAGESSFLLEKKQSEEKGPFNPSRNNQTGLCSTFFRYEQKKRGVAGSKSGNGMALDNGRRRHEDPSALRGPTQSAKASVEKKAYKGGLRQSGRQLAKRRRFAKSAEGVKKKEKHSPADRVANLQNTRLRLIWRQESPSHHD